MDVGKEIDEEDFRVCADKAGSTAIGVAGSHALEIGNAISAFDCSYVKGRFGACQLIGRDRPAIVLVTQHCPDFFERRCGYAASEIDAIFQSCSELSRRARNSRPSYHRAIVAPQQEAGTMKIRERSPFHQRWVNFDHMPEDRFIR